MQNDYVEFQANQLHKMFQGMDMEKKRVISSAKDYLRLDKNSDYDNQVIFRFLRKIYPESDFKELLTI